MQRKDKYVRPQKFLANIIYVIILFSYRQTYENNLPTYIKESKVKNDNNKISKSNIKNKIATKCPSKLILPA